MKILDTQVSVSIIPLASKQASKLASNQASTQARKQASKTLTFKVTIRKFIYKSSLIIRCGLSAGGAHLFYFVRPMFVCFQSDRYGVLRWNVNCCKGRFDW